MAPNHPTTTTTSSARKASLPYRITLNSRVPVSTEKRDYLQDQNCERKYRRLNKAKTFWNDYPVTSVPSSRKDNRQKNTRTSMMAPAIRIIEGHRNAHVRERLTSIANMVSTGLMSVRRTKITLGLRMQHTKELRSCPTMDLEKNTSLCL
jgi:hypothetical protein